eukprot:COSAG02_NODE_12304_length_1565_cov_1.899045_3_plen_66_part_01
MSITPEQGQAMVDSVAAKLRIEHPGFPVYRHKKSAGPEHYYEAPASKDCLLSPDGPHSKKKVSCFK